jgi:hypothetical protein
MNDGREWVFLRDCEIQFFSVFSGFCQDFYYVNKNNILTCI